MPLPATTAAYCLSLFVGRADPEPLVLRLYCGPRPTKEGVYRECSEGGYRSVTLMPARWRVSDETLKAVYPDVLFTFIGPLTDPVRGYCLTGERSGAVRHWEAFAEEVKPEFAGAELRVNLRLEWIREA